MSIIGMVLRKPAILYTYFTLHKARRYIKNSSFSSLQLGEMLVDYKCKDKTKIVFVMISGPCTQIQLPLTAVELLS